MVWCILSFMFCLLQVTDARNLGSDLTVLSCLFASFGVTMCVQGLSCSLLLFSWEYETVSSIRQKANQKELSIFSYHYVLSVDFQSLPSWLDPWIFANIFVFILYNQNSLSKNFFPLFFCNIWFTCFYHWHFWPTYTICIMNSYFIWSLKCYLVFRICGMIWFF